MGLQGQNVLPDVGGNGVDLFLCGIVVDTGACAQTLVHHADRNVDGALQNVVGDRQHVLFVGSVRLMEGMGVGPGLLVQNLLHVVVDMPARATAPDSSFILMLMPTMERLPTSTPIQLVGLLQKPGIDKVFEDGIK